MPKFDSITLIGSLRRKPLLQIYILFLQLSDVKGELPEKSGRIVA